MPGDTLFINNKAKKQNTYDAIIVGSGITGGWAAKELCEKGLKVLLLECLYTLYLKGIAWHKRSRNVQNN
jgi:ribulose 1,5-bisphosphate synthetase/thiazole synthase